MPNRTKFLRAGTTAAIICLLLDQIHKFIMLEIYDFESLKDKIEVTGFFNLVMVWNRGISFGMFQGLEYSNYFFMALATTIIITIFFLIRNSKHLYEAVAFGMIIGGAAGNLVDRIRMGAVADFFDFYLGSQHWPAFNIADSCVFLGAALLILGTFFKREKKDEK